MFVVELHFTSRTGALTEDQCQVIDVLIGLYRMNGNTLGREFPAIQDGNRRTVFTMIPDTDALESRFFNSYIHQRRNQLAELQLDQTHRILGFDPDSAAPCTCQDSSGFILFTNYVSLESPLRCADCVDPVPLYRIPRFPSSDSYYDIICWQSDYQACDTLQMGCATGERFGSQQMSLPTSSLSQRGIALCREIQQLTGKPCFYYLYRYTAKSYRTEIKRKCPNCQGEWRLAQVWHDFFDFKCDQCRLVSNISWSVR